MQKKKKTNNSIAYIILYVMYIILKYIQSVLNGQIARTQFTEKEKRKKNVIQSSVANTRVG